MSWLKAKDWATGVEYSSLFHSGLRAISRTPRARRARAYSSSSSSREKSLNGATPSIVPRLLKRSTTRTRHPSPPTSVPTSSSPTLPPQAPKVTRPRPSSMFVRPTKEMAEAWSAGGSFFEIGDHPKFPEEERCRGGHLMPQIEIDTPRALAGSRPFIVNLGEMDASAVPSIGEESFLLLSSDPDAFLHHPTQRCECPVSRSGLSSVHHHARETSRERGNYGWMLEESSPEVTTYELGEEDEEKIQLDDERVADWRQFHVDWLRAIH